MSNAQLAMSNQPETNDRWTQSHNVQREKAGEAIFPGFTLVPPDTKFDSDPERGAPWKGLPGLRAAQAFSAVKALVASSVADRDMPAIRAGGRIRLEMSNGVTQVCHHPSTS